MNTPFRSRFLAGAAAAALCLATAGALADVHASTGGHSSGSTGGGGHTAGGGGHAHGVGGASHYGGGRYAGGYGGGRYAGGYAPRGGYSAAYHGEHFHYRGGRWWGWRGGGWYVSAPPFGLWLPFLPLYYSTYWWGGYPYYYADAVYYRASEAGNGYEVVEPPPGAPTDVPAGGATVFAYPREGQPAEQQSKDRYECHRWAADQTGFDPTQPGGGVPANANAARRSDYERAESACLEARGYTVK
jgi:hypothetical protein